MGSKALVSAVRLHNYIFSNFWNGKAIVGPDPGLMLELRLLRFMKSYFPSLSQHDSHCFLQAQGYWIRSNWDMFEITGDMKYKEIAIACSRYIMGIQKSDGSWEYPLKEWRQYISTVEGTWASLGLLETFRKTEDPAFLKSALRWYDFLIGSIGFQAFHGSLAVNYFNRSKLRVPNNTTLVLWFFAELYAIEKDERFLKYADKMIEFIQLCQNGKGELIYAVEREHYLCYHYNAFEFLDLFHYYETVGDERIRTVLERLAHYLSFGVTAGGSVKYDCFQILPEVTLFSGVVGAALTKAASIGIEGYDRQIQLAYSYLFQMQRTNGSFVHSKYDMPYVKKPYRVGFLTDKRSYPRSLSYILQHILVRTRSEAGVE